MSKPRTIIEKIWDNHVVAERANAPALLYIDLHLVHEVTSPQAFDGLRAPYGESALAQQGKCLRGGHLVHQVQIDIEHRRGSGTLGAHLVPLPDLFEESLRGTRHQPDAATRGAAMST